ncbi:hypothetical protein DKX38_018067 [Salix brachista]|uniref:Uncharacterized protein n=1 Tax=Salix brachista TaxID=2182728 RepID=A0A5N5KXX4_9ROSI|nr:hypothetical protein DKX38_018067 [Salix brachista]
MPRRPTRRLRSMIARPLTFVPAKSLGLPQTMKGVRSVKKALKAKNESLSLSLLRKKNFAFFDPKSDDFHGVKILLRSYLDNKEWDLSGFVDLVLGQATVGTVVKIEDDEDNGLFSVVPVLDLGRYKASSLLFEMLPPPFSISSFNG